MNLKASVITSVFILAAMGSAQAQVPSVAAAWGEMKLSQAACLERGVAAFKRLNFKRIEAVGFSVYADFEKFQLAVRCVPDKQIYFVYGGGPGDDEKPLLKHINAVKAELDR
jgi:hypothetical protein